MRCRESSARERITPVGRSLLALAIVGAIAVTGCGAEGSGSGGAGGKVTVPPDQALKRQKLPGWLKLPPVESLKDRGNVGEKPAWYTDVELSPEQVEAVRGKKLKA